MLQIRIIDADGANPVILEGASDIVYSKSLNSSDEGISFQIRKNDSKADNLSPYNDSSYARFWEVWDTAKNKKLNFGPITSIDDSDIYWKVEGRGRSALLADYFKTLKTFYARIDSIIEEIRYENVAISPSSTTMIVDITPEDGIDDSLFTGNFDDKFYNLSSRSKDFVIDEQTGYIPLGKVEPPRTYSTTNQYWTGMSNDDTIAVDFGDEYKISKIRLLFPWWGGPQRANNRTYDFTLVYAGEGANTTYGGRPIGTVHELWDNSPALKADMMAAGESIYMWAPQPSYVINKGSRVVTTPANPMELYVGVSNSGLGTNLNTYNICQWSPGPITMRYLAVQIYNVNALYGSSFDTAVSKNYYPYQCYPGYQPGDISVSPINQKIGLMTRRKKDGTIVAKEFSDTDIKPSNDCHASVVEIGAYQEIIQRKSVKALALQRIDNNNMQISYYRVPDTTEFKLYIKDGKHYRKYEPGTKFRRFNISWAGADNTYYKFYKSDCSNCYPDGFSFGIVDDDNTKIYSSDNSSGTATVTGRQYTKHFIARGTSDITLNWIDCWRGRMSTLSWGGSYSYTEKANDTFTVHFRGESFKWYASIPSGKTGATVKIEYRSKMDTAILGASMAGTTTWNAWVTLENSFKLPDGPIDNQVVYELSYESGLLQSETVYQIRVTLLDNNFCSVDSIEGYWSGSFTEYNEDSSRIILSQPDVFKQIYSGRFTNGTMYKWNKPGASASLYFEGDRIIIQSAKGKYHGKLTFLLLQYTDGLIDYDDGTKNTVFIPGGNATNGTLEIDLNTGKKGQEIPNFICFDSNDKFPDGLPWGKYQMFIIYTPAEKYTADKNEVGSNSFQYRCRTCNPKPPGDPVQIYRYVYLDAIGVHERVGLSVDFNNQSHLEIVESIADAIQVEWDAGPEGITMEPRIGQDTYIALREGENTLVSYSIINDISKVATTLLSVGASIDGLDQFTITEDKGSKRLFKRTIMRQHDFRDIASYNQLIGLSRSELKRRSRPQRRITVRHIAESLDLEHGDSFILWTKKAGNMRLRIERKQISESSNGREYELECIEWPPIS